MAKALGILHKVVMALSKNPIEVLCYRLVDVEVRLVIYSFTGLR